MDTRELKPCPFCGMNLFFDNNSFTWMHPKYPCPAAGYEPFRTDDEWAANKWNTRASNAALSSQAAEIERLREALEDAHTELLEAADKFNVIHHNHPGAAADKGIGCYQAEDKEYCAKYSDRAAQAARRARRTLAQPNTEVAR